MEATDFMFQKAFEGMKVIWDFQSDYGSKSDPKEKEAIPNQSDPDSESDPKRKTTIPYQSDPKEKEPNPNYSEQSTSCTKTYHLRCLQKITIMREGRPFSHVTINESKNSEDLMSEVNSLLTLPRSKPSHIANSGYSANFKFTPESISYRQRKARRKIREQLKKLLKKDNFSPF